MTISNSAATQIFLGNGVTNPFTASIIAAPANSTATQAASNIQVIYTDTDGVATTLAPSAYTLSFNAEYQGFSVTYPTIGSPIADGTSLTVTRIVPFTQTTSISNQGDFAPAVIESALDNLELQIQQAAARTGQFRGTWITDTVYNFGDIVQDGANGTNTGNYYMCITSNTSDVWSTDLADGDWVIVIDKSALISGVTSVGFTNGNGFTGVVTNPSTNPTLALATTVNGIAKGNGTALSAATPGTDYLSVLTGDGTTSGNAFTLATVNSNVGSFTNASVTVDGKGRITAASNGSAPTNTYVLLNTQTSGSAVAAFTFNSTLTSAYDDYIFIFQDMISAAGTTPFQMYYSTDNGSTYLSSYNWSNSGFATLGGATQTTSAAAASAFIQLSLGNIASGATGSVAGRAELIGVNGTNRGKMVVADITGGTASANTCYATSTATTAVNAVKFQFATGNISGKIYCYGVKNT